MSSQSNSSSVEDAKATPPTPEEFAKVYLIRDERGLRAELRLLLERIPCVLAVGLGFTAVAAAGSVQSGRLRISIECRRFSNIAHIRSAIHDLNQVHKWRATEEELQDDFMFTGYTSFTHEDIKEEILNHNPLLPNQGDGEWNTNWYLQLSQIPDVEGISIGGELYKTVADVRDQIDYNFNAGVGASTDGAAFTLWTPTRVFFPVTYDGAAWISSLPRHPCDESTLPQGGT